MSAFIDSNVLLYLLDADAAKADRAEQLLIARGVVSVQVLNEVAAVATRKHRLAATDLDDLLRAVRDACAVQPLTIDTHQLGLVVAWRHRLGVHDSMLIAAALLAGCDIFWSEDMHDGLVVDGRLTIRNPFA